MASEIRKPDLSATRKTVLPPITTNLVVSTKDMTLRTVFDNPGNFLGLIIHRFGIDYSCFNFDLRKFATENSLEMAIRRFNG